METLQHIISYFFRPRRISHKETEKDEILPFEKIPGPIRIPFLGLLNELFTLGSPKNVHKNIDELHKKYGTIFRMNLSGCNTIFVSSDVYMKGIYRNEGRCPRHIVPENWVYLNQEQNFKRGLFFMEGEEWLKYRKIMNPIFLRHFDETHNYAIETATDHFINQLQVTKTKKIENLEDLLYHWSVNVLLQLMIGYESNINEVVPKVMASEFASSVQDIFKLSAEINSLSPKWAQKLMPKAWNAFKEAVRVNLKLGHEIIDKIIEANPNGGLYSQLKEAQLNDFEMKRIFTDLIIAAGDTTAAATQWALYLIAKNFDEQTNLRGLSYESSDAINVVKETLRLYPTAFVIGRFIDKETILDNYKIPKDTLALMSMYTAGRSEENFFDADAFVPSRWDKIEDQFPQVFNPQASTPFASGSRDCIGRKIAMISMQMIITKMVNSFEIKLLNKNEVDIITKMVLVPKESIRLELTKLE